MKCELINVSIIKKTEYNFFLVRAIFILKIFLAFGLSGCATIEVAKEVSRATESISTSIKKIGKSETKKTSEETKVVVVTEEKEKINEDKKKKQKIVLNQTKITKVDFLNKNLDQLIDKLGEPKLIRNSGNTKTARFDHRNCKIFIFFDISKSKLKSDYFELRNNNGELLKTKEEINACYKDIRLS